jgi:transcriptional regulator with XRE-family HTH domain
LPVTATELKLIFGRNVQRLRELRRLSRAELASAIGASVQVVHRLEAGKQFATAETLASLANTLQIPVAALLASGETSDDWPAEKFRQLTDQDKVVVEAMIDRLVHRDRSE